MMEMIRRFRTTMENCIHEYEKKRTSKREKDTRQQRDENEDEDEDEQKKLKREKGLIDHEINQGCPRWFSLKTLFALLPYDAVVAAAAVAAAVAAATASRGASGQFEMMMLNSLFSGGLVVLARCRVYPLLMHYGSLQVMAV